MLDSYIPSLWHIHQSADHFCPPTCPALVRCMCVCQNRFDQSIWLHDRWLQTEQRVNGVTADTPWIWHGPSRFLRQSSAFCQVLIKTNQGKSTKMEAIQCKYSSSSFSCLSPSSSINVETTANKKNGSLNQNQVAPVSRVSQKSDTIRFRWDYTIVFPKKLQGLCIYMSWYISKLPNPSNVPVCSTLLLVNQMFAYFPWTISHTKQPRIAVG